MYKFIAVGVVLFSYLFGVVPVRADDITDDVHCYIVYAEMTLSADANTRGAAAIGELYWLGVLDGRKPDLDLENAILSEEPKMTGAYFANEAVRCGQQLVKRGQAVTEIGKAITQKENQTQQQRNSN